MTSDQALQAPQHRIDFFRPTYFVLVAVLGFLILMPLLWLLYYSLRHNSGAAGFTLGNFVTLVTDTGLMQPFLLSIEMSAGVGVLCCVVATPLAWLVARTNLPGRRLVRALVMASFVTPPFLGAIAWEILAAPNSGLINYFFREVTGAPRSDHLINIYTMEGLIFVISCYTFPYVFTLVANGLDRVPSDLEDASAILGARTFSTLRRITIPLVLPALLAGALIAVLQSLTMFGAPAVLALPAGFYVATTKIWSMFQFPPQLSLAAAASVPLFLIALLLLQGKSWILGRKGYTVVGGKSGEPRLTALGRWKPLAIAFVAIVVSLTILLPYLALLKTAFSHLVTDSFSFKNFTLSHFDFVFFQFSDTQQAIWNTFFLGILTASIGTVVALLTAYMVSRNAVRGASKLGILATAPIAIPNIVLGVGFFLTYSQPEFRLYGTLWILLLAFLTITLPAAYQQMSAAFQGIHFELEEAARILGGSRMSTLFRITAPLLRTSVIATWCFIFIGTIRELSAAVLLTTANTKLISVMIYDLNESNDLGSISVLGILLLVVSFAVILLVTHLRSRDNARLEVAH